MRPEAHHRSTISGETFMQFYRTSEASPQTDEAEAATRMSRPPLLTKHRCTSPRSTEPRTSAPLGGFRPAIPKLDATVRPGGRQGALEDWSPPLPRAIATRLVPLATLAAGYNGPRCAS